jgi:preprotein translocase subunit SecD
MSGKPAVVLTVDTTSDDRAERLAALFDNADGAAKMLRASQSHIGRPLAILIDGEVVMAPVVRSPIRTSAVITGSFTRAEAERIVAGIPGR